MAGTAPGKTWTSGLEFTENDNVRVDWAKKADADVERAHEIIKEKLPLMNQMEGVISLTLGASEPIFLDFRSSEAKLVTEFDGEPTTTLNMKAEYISQFYEGKLEPRYGLFKDAFFHPASMPKGSIPLGIKFADLLTPNPPVAPKKVVPGAFPRLPQPTEDLDQVKRDIVEFGYGLFKNALTPQQNAILKKAVQEQAAGENAAGVGKEDGGGSNQRIWTLVNKGGEFLDFLNHPLIDALVPWFLGEHALIHSYSANITRPGGSPMQLHTDQIAVQPPLREIAFGLNILWFLEDFSEENGGTRIFPASHLGAIAPEDIFSIEGTLAAEGTAGTALITDSRIWHATGPNHATTGERPAILMFFMRSFIRQQENNFLSLRKEVWEKLSDRQKKMLGFITTGALGGIEGEVREGIFVERKEDCVGTLRAPHVPRDGAPKEDAKEETKDLPVR